jgi:cyclic lactone autoinducer peptide
MKNLMIKLSTLVAGLALVVTTVTTNSVCCFLMNQPELPEKAERLRKR